LPRPDRRRRLRLAGPAATPTTFDYRTTADGPCPQGGTLHADLRVSGSFDAANGQSGSYQGAVDWSSDGRSGTCGGGGAFVFCPFPGPRRIVVA
jgi:hypothetical protein